MKKCELAMFNNLRVNAWILYRLSKGRLERSSILGFGLLRMTYKDLDNN